MGDTMVRIQQRAHIEIAQMISNLLEAERKRVANAEIASSLLEYCAQFWPQHATKVIHYDNMDAIELQRKIDRSFSSKEEFTSWLHIHDPDHEGYRERRRKPKPLYYASLLGLDDTVKMLLQTQSDTLGDVKEGTFENPINAAAIKGNFKVVKALLEHFSNGGTIVRLALIAEKIEENVEHTFQILLHQDSGVHIDCGLVFAAIRNYNRGEQVLALSSEKRWIDIVITEEVVEVIARNFSREIMSTLLEKQGGDVVITEEVVKAAAGNYLSGDGIIALLLVERGADVVITEGVVKAAAEYNGNGEGIMALLLEKRGADVVITEEVVRAAAGNYLSGDAIMALLLEKRGADVVEAARRRVFNPFCFVPWGMSTVLHS